MKMFDSVVVACDNSPECERAALAIRSLLEQGYSLRVHFMHLLWKRQVIEFLAGEMPPADFVVLIVHGADDGQEGFRLHFHVMHQKDDDYEDENGCEQLDWGLNSGQLAELVKKGRGTFFTSSCKVAEDKTVAEAFLNAGYEHFIAAHGTPEWDAVLLFTTGLFYHLLANDRDRTQKTPVMSVPEAVRRASLLDPDYRQGTKLFQCFSKAQS